MWVTAQLLRAGLRVVTLLLTARLSPLRRSVANRARSGNQRVTTTAAALLVSRLGKPVTRLAEPCVGQGWVQNNENTSFTRYYEHDGMLRAYANRAMFLAILFAVTALSSLGFAIYVRVQPPTVIRVDK